MRKMLLILLSVAALCMVFSAYAQETDGEIAYKTVTVPLIQEGAFPEEPEENLAVMDAEREALMEDLKEQILKDLTDCKESYNIVNNIGKGKSITVDEAYNCFFDVVNCNPQLFYVSGTFSCSHYKDSDCIVEIYYKYSMTKSEINSAKEFYQEEIKKILAGAQSGWSDFEKILYIHDYICTHFEYDDGLTIRDVYTFLKERTGVCQAYSLLFSDLAGRLGLTWDYATSKSMSHVWNLVKLGDNWYHVDATWDDPLYSADRYDMLSSARHTYFLLSDDEIQDTSVFGESGIHHDWFNHTGAECTEEYADDWWRDIARGMTYLAGKWYFVKNNGSGQYNIYSREGINGADEILSTGWNSYYHSTAYYQSYLYYNTPKTIMCYDPATKKSDTVEIPDIGTKYIRGIYIYDGILYYQLSDSSFENREILNVKLRTPDTVSITRNAIIDHYVVGQAINTAGLIVTVKYTNGEEETVNIERYDITADLSKAGTATITITYMGKSTSYDVTVAETAETKTYGGCTIRAFSDGYVTVTGGSNNVYPIAARYSGGKMTSLAMLSSDTSAAQWQLAGTGTTKIFLLTEELAPAA